MIKLTDILLEKANIVKSFTRITFSEELNATEVKDIIRSIPGVTIVRSTNTEDGIGNRITMIVKIRTTKSGEEAFQDFRKQALTFPGIRRVEIATKTIEKV